MADADSSTTNQLDRETASALNPFIGLFIEETLNNVAAAMVDLGYMCNLSEEKGMPPRHDGIWRMTNAMSAALQYESRYIANLDLTTTQYLYRR